MAPPSWRSRTTLTNPASLESFRSTGSLFEQDNRPIIVYVTSSDPELEKKVASFESTVFSNEKLLIGLKFFDAFKIDLEDLDEGDPLLKALKNPRPMTFYTYHSGSFLYQTKPEPSSPELVSLCSRTFSKIYKGSFDSLLKKETKILDEIEKIDLEVDRILEKRDRNPSRISKNESKKLDMKLEKLETRREELKQKEAALLTRE